MSSAYLTKTRQCVLTLKEATDMLTSWATFHPDHLLGLSSYRSLLSGDRVWEVEVYNEDGPIGYLFNDEYYRIDMELKLEEQQ